MNYRSYFRVTQVTQGTQLFHPLIVKKKKGIYITEWFTCATLRHPAPPFAGAL